MAQSKTRTAPETEDLANELAALREDFSALTRDLKSLAQARGETLSDKTAEQVVALKSASERQMAKAGELAGKASREAESYVREHPATTVAASAVLGFVIGAIAARR